MGLTEAKLGRAGLVSPATEDGRLVVLRRSGLLVSTPESEFDRWTATLREDTGAAVAAFLLNDATRVLIKSVSTVHGAADHVAEISLGLPSSNI